MDDKSQIRNVMRAMRKGLSPDEKTLVSHDICEKILKHPEIATAQNSFAGGGAVAVYLAAPDEIDLSKAISEMLSNGVAVVAPRWNGEMYELAKLKSLRDEDLRKGPMGILEPKDADIIPPKDVAVWLVPGLAFTRDGKRLGYGGGWYDRLMMTADARALKMGIAYEFQVIDDLPTEPHDVRVDDVVDDV